MRITISGNYGINNLGDEAILDGLLRVLKSAFPRADIAVLSSNPAETEKLHSTKSLMMFPAGLRSFFSSILSLNFFRSWWRIFRTDLFVLGGGGLFQNESRGAVRIWFCQCLWPALLRKKIVMLGQSVGPLRSRFSRSVFRYLFRIAKLVTVRDQKSKELLSSLGINNVHVLGDFALGLGYDFEGKPHQEDFLILSLRPWNARLDGKLDLEFAKFIDWVFETHHLQTKFVPFQIAQENDLIRARSIESKINNKQALEVVTERLDYQAAMELLARAKYVIGMRLHSIIFSLLNERPAVVISYSDKVKNFAHDANFPEILDYQNISLENLKNIFKQYLDNYSETKNELEKSKIKMTYKLFEHEKLLRDLFSSNTGG